MHVIPAVSLLCVLLVAFALLCYSGFTYYKFHLVGGCVLLVGWILIAWWLVGCGVGVGCWLCVACCCVLVGVWLCVPCWCGEVVLGVCEVWLCMLLYVGWFVVGWWACCVVGEWLLVVGVDMWGHWLTLRGAGWQGPLGKRLDGVPKRGDRLDCVTQGGALGVKV